jgi:hypothetical protein
MNKYQTIFLWIGMVIFVIVGVFPPWTGSYAANEYFNGYGFILNPPKFNERVCISYLCVEWIMVAVITGGLLVTFKDKKKN